MDNVERSDWQIDKFKHSLIAYGKPTRHFPNTMYLDVYENPTYATCGLICDHAIRRVLKCFMSYYCDLRINPSDFLVAHEDKTAAIQFVREYDFQLTCIFFRKSPNFKVVEIDALNKMITVMHISDYKQP